MSGKSNNSVITLATKFEMKIEATFGVEKFSINHKFELVSAIFGNTIMNSKFNPMFTPILISLIV